MTAESASMQGKDSTPALQKVWVPPHPRRTACKGRFCSFAKHRCLHTHNIQRASILQSMGVLTPITYYVFYTALLFVYSCFEADTMFQYSFKILPDRLKLIRLYPCGSLGQSISFVFGARVGHFTATPQSDVVGVCSHDLGVMATLSVRQKMPFFVHL